MSNNDDHGSGSDEGGNPNAALRIARQEKDKLEEQLQGFLRREAARDAGLDMKNPQHRFFVEKYDGDLNELGTFAQTLGYISSPDQQQQQEADQSTAALGRVAGTGAGGGAASSTPKSQADVQIRQEAKDLMSKVKNRQTSQEEVMEWAQKAGVPIIGDDS